MDSAHILCGYCTRFHPFLPVKKPQQKQTVCKQSKNLPGSHRFPADLCAWCLRLLELLEAVGADVLALVNRDVLRIAAEHAGRLVLFQNDRRTVHINFNGILLRDVQSPAQLNRQYDSAQLIHFSHNACRFHLFVPPFVVSSTVNTAAGGGLPCVRRESFLLIGLILTVIYVQILNKLDFAEEIYRNVIYLVIFPRREPDLRRAHRSSVRFIGRSNAGRAAGCGALPVSVRRTVPVERRCARHGEKRADAEAFVRAFSVSVAHFPGNLPGRRGARLSLRKFHGKPSGARQRSNADGRRLCAQNADAEPNARTRRK